MDKQLIRDAIAWVDIASAELTSALNMDYCAELKALVSDAAYRFEYVSKLLRAMEKGNE